MSDDGGGRERGIIKADCGGGRERGIIKADCGRGCERGYIIRADGDEVRKRGYIRSDGAITSDCTDGEDSYPNQLIIPWLLKRISGVANEAERSGLKTFSTE